MKYAALLFLVAYVAGSASAAEISVFTDAAVMQRTASAGGVSASVPATAGYGGGVSSSIRLGAKTGLELGAIYQVRALSDTSRFPYAVFPVSLAFGFSRFLDLDLGGYFAFAAGNMIAADGSSQSFATGGYCPNDYGARAGFKVSLPMSEATRFLLGAHYTYGLAELQASPVPGTSLRWNGFDLIAGLTFGAK